MPPKHSKHRPQVKTTQLPGRALAPKTKERTIVTERMLEKRSLNNTILGTALDVALDGLDEAAARRRRVDFGLSNRQWQEVCNLAQALGLGKDEAVARVNQHTVHFEAAPFESVDTAGGGADEEFTGRVKRHQMRRAKKLLKKQAQRDETDAAVDSESTKLANASENAALALPQLAPSTSHSEENRATEVARSLPLLPVENTTTAQVVPISQQAPDVTEPGAPSDDASSGASTAAAHHLTLASVNPVPVSHPTTSGANPVARSPRSERRAAEHCEQVRKAKAYGATAVVQRPNALVRTRAATEDVLKPQWGKPIEAILAEHAAAGASPGATGSSLKQERTIDSAATDDDDDDERTVKRCKLFTNEKTVEDLEEEVESRIRWAEHNRVFVFPVDDASEDEDEDEDYEWAVPPPPPIERLESMHPPALIEGAAPGKVKYLSSSGVRIQEAPPKLERRRIKRMQRIARWAEYEASQSIGATVEGSVERAENDPGPDAAQGEPEVAEGDEGDEVQEAGGEEEEVHAQEHVEGEEVRAQESREVQKEDGFVSTFRETFSPPPNWYDDESLGEPDELSLDA